MWVGRGDSDSTRWPQALLSMLHIRTRTQAHTCWYVIIWHGVSVCVPVCVCECAKTINIKCTNTHTQTGKAHACVCVNVEANLRLINFNVSPRTPFAGFAAALFVFPFYSLSLTLSSPPTSLSCAFFCLFFATWRAHLPAIISQCGAHLSAKEREWWRERGRKGELSRKSNW